MWRITVLVVLAMAGLLQISSARAAGSFFLHDGDRVCFYGDSITEQRFYPVAVETYVLTRFPNLKVDFVDSGVGGDRVTGGWAGNINVRLKRDVYPFKPTVVTIMLGMNDASYRPFDQNIFDT
ncbi:MAG: GDSL-type esterase/lipase family protein [Phycisphaerae bacterium]